MKLALFCIVHEQLNRCRRVVLSNSRADMVLKDFLFVVKSTCALHNPPDLQKKFV